MKNFTFILLIAFFFVACNNKAEEPITENDTVNDVIGWKADLNDSSGRLEMKKNDAAILDSLSIPSVIAFLNKTYPNILLEFVRSSHDTIFLKIPESDYLTQQMGSTGPTMYFATAVYNLTEVPGFRFVDFSFEEGDHASPATLNRDSFKDE